MRKKLSEFTKKLTDCNNPRVNAFYDITPRIFITLLILEGMLNQVISSRTLHRLNKLYPLLLLISSPFAIVLVILMIIHLVKRTKKEDTDLSKESRYWIPATLLNTIGVLLLLINIFLTPKTLIFFIIALILIPTSILFYAIAYKKHTQKLFDNSTLLYSHRFWFSMD